MFKLNLKSFIHKFYPCFTSLKPIWHQLLLKVALPKSQQAFHTWIWALCPTVPDGDSQAQTN